MTIRERRGRSACTHAPNSESDLQFYQCSMDSDCFDQSPPQAKRARKHQKLPTTKRKQKVKKSRSISIQNSNRIRMSRCKLRRTAGVLGSLQNRLSAASQSLSWSLTEESEATNGESGLASAAANHKLGSLAGLGKLSPETAHSANPYERTRETLAPAAKTSALQRIQLSSHLPWVVELVRHVVSLEEKVNEIQSRVHSHGHSIEEQKGLASDANSLSEGIQQDLKRISECQLSLAKLITLSTGHHQRLVHHTACKKCRRNRRRNRAQYSNRGSRCDSRYYDADDEIASTDSVSEQLRSIGHDQKQVVAAPDISVQVDSDSGSNECSSSSNKTSHHHSQSLAVLSTGMSTQDPSIPAVDICKLTCSTPSTPEIVSADKSERRQDQAECRLVVGDKEILSAASSNSVEVANTNGVCLTSISQVADTSVVIPTVGIKEKNVDMAQISKQVKNHGSGQLTTFLEKLLCLRTSEKKDGFEDQVAESGQSLDLSLCQVRKQWTYLKQLIGKSADSFEAAGLVGNEDQVEGTYNRKEMPPAPRSGFRGHELPYHQVPKPCRFQKMPLTHKRSNGGAVNSSGKPPFVKLEMDGKFTWVSLVHSFRYLNLTSKDLEHLEKLMYGSTTTVSSISEYSAVNCKRETKPYDDIVASEMYKNLCDYPYSLAGSVMFCVRFRTRCIIMAIERCVAGVSIQVENEIMRPQTSRSCIDDYAGHANLALDASTLENRKRLNKDPDKQDVLQAENGIGDCSTEKEFTKLDLMQHYNISALTVPTGLLSISLTSDMPHMLGHYDAEALLLRRSVCIAKYAAKIPTPMAIVDSVPEKSCIVLCAVKLWLLRVPSALMSADKQESGVLPGTAVTIDQSGISKEGQQMTSQQARRSFDHPYNVLPCQEESSSDTLEKTKKDLLQKAQQIKEEFFLSPMFSCYSLNHSLLKYISLCQDRKNLLLVLGKDMGKMRRENQDRVSILGQYGIRNGLGRDILQYCTGEHPDVAIHYGLFGLQGMFDDVNQLIMSIQYIKKYAKDFPFLDNEGQSPYWQHWHRTVERSELFRQRVTRDIMANNTDRFISQNSRSARVDRQQHIVSPSLQYSEQEEPGTPGQTSLHIDQLEEVVVQQLSVQPEELLQQSHLQATQEVKEDALKSGGACFGAATSVSEPERCIGSLHQKVLEVPHAVASSVEYASGAHQPSAAVTQAVQPWDSLKLSCHQPHISGNLDLGEEQVTVDLVDYRYEELEEATRGFDSRPVEKGGCKIGAGSFAEVFHARLRNAAGVIQEVAVKKLKQPKSSKKSQMKLSEQQFPSELMALRRYHHPNIVRLIGQCRGPERCLVYEYLPGRNLALLLAKDNPNALGWPVRVKLLCNVASAVNHLHTAHNPGLVHRDIKTANILLSDKLEGILGDFGLSILTEDADPLASFSVSTAAGTRSYMAPEAFKGKVSPRVDVYSFGVVIYEVITGLPSYSSSKKEDLATYMRELERQGGDLLSMVDPRAQWPRDLAANLIKLARWCTDYDSHSRPPMGKVLAKLEMLYEDRAPSDS